MDSPDAQGRVSPALKGEAVSSFRWSALSYGGSRVLIFGMTLALARLLTAADFGVVAGGMAIVTLLELGLDLGLGASLIYDQEAAITRRVQTVFTVNMAVSVALAALGVLAAPAVARLLSSPEQTSLYRALFLYLIVRGMNQVPDAILKRDLRFRRRAGIDAARVGVRVILALALAAGGAGAWSIVASLLVGELIVVPLSWHAVRFWPTFQLDRAAGRQLLDFGLLVLLLKVVDALALDSDYLVVGARLGPTALGQYTISYRLPELLLINFYWIFSTVAFPTYVRYRHQGNAALATVMLRALRLIALVSLPAGIGLAVVARDAVLVLFGPRWAPAAAPMALIALTTGLMSIGYASGDIYAATGRPATLLWLNVPFTGVLIVAMIGAAPAGITAVAAVHLALAALYAPARLLLANRRVGASLRSELVALWPGTVAGLGILAVAGPVRFLLPPGGIALTATVIAGVLGAAAATWLWARETMTEAAGLLRNVRA